MSELTKLLEGVKAEWKSLGEVVKLEKGKQLNKEMLALEGTYPAYNGGISYSGFTERYNYDGNKTIISQGGASAGFVNFIATKFYANAHCYVVLPHVDKVNNRYIYHVLKLNQNKLTKKQFGAGIPALKTADILNIPILIPCPDNPEKSLKIQQEIVRILDSLSEETNQLNAALQKELVLHQKQYNFYREKLFKFEGKEVGWKKISEIGKFQRGKRFVRTDMISEGVPCIHYGEMYTHYGISAAQSKSYLNREFALAKKLRVADKGDVVIVAAGETVEDIGKGTAWLGDEGVVTHDACFSYKSPLNPTYFAYFTRTSQYHDQIKRNISSGKISAINEKGFSSVIIPVPSPEQQNRIVKILDELDAKTLAIKTAIQKEIALRNKQYEYYRERLLSFQSLETISSPSLRAEGEAIQKKDTTQ